MEESKKAPFKKQIHKIYGQKSITCSSNFLDFVLDPPTYLTGQIKNDLYTFRIFRLLMTNKKDLSKMACKLQSKCSQTFFERQFKCYLPEILIPTEHMNLYFHRLSDCGKLEFLKLRPSWKETFPLDSASKNSSKLSRNIDSANKITPFLSSEIVSRINRKSQLALYLHKKSYDLIDASK